MSEPPFNQKFALCLTRHQTSLYAYILSLLGDRQSAEDVLQQTNLTLLQKADEFDPDSDFLAWACTVARYKVLAARRDVARLRQRLSGEVIEQITDRLDAEMTRLDDRRDALRLCLDKLTEEERGLMKERYEVGSTVAKLAQAAGRTVAAISQKLYRIREKLSDCVEATMARSN